MKINIIGTGLFYSGGMRVIFEYANRLTDLGHDICLYFPYKPYKFGNENLILMSKRFYWGIKDSIFNNSGLKALYKCRFKIAGVPQISNIFIRDADVSIATQWPTAYDIYKLSPKKGKKIYFLQDYEVWDSDKHRVNNALRLNLKKITISKFNQQFFKDEFGIETYVVLNGIDYQKYHCENKRLNQKKIISFIEHHLDSKGVQNAIRTVQKLHQKYPDVQFKCFGHKKYHDIPNYVEFRKNPSDDVVAEEIYGKTDIFIYPSLKEGFALPPAEAMACKCAVVTTPVGAIPEYSTHMESAIHVTPGNPEEMFNAVCYLLDNENEIIRISKNAYSHIRKTLNWDRSVLEFEKLLMSN